MKYKFLRNILIVFSIAILSACSSMGSHHDADYVTTTDSDGNVHAVPADQASNSSKVETFGLGAQDSLEGRQFGFVNGKPTKQVYYFDFDSNQVHTTDFSNIKAQAHYLASHPSVHIRVEGNTDERGSREYNVALGERRAQAVANLLEVEGAKKNQIDIVSYGQEKPIATGHSERSYRLNRRAELAYMDMNHEKNH